MYGWWFDMCVHLPEFIQYSRLCKSASMGTKWCYASCCIWRHTVMTSPIYARTPCFVPNNHRQCCSWRHMKLYSFIWLINSLAPGKFEWNFRYVIFKWILVIDGWGISCEVAIIWMLLDFTDDQSTLVQVMAWCRQAASHYLSQCWPRSLSPYGVTRPQWVNFKYMKFKFVWNWIKKSSVPLAKIGYPARYSAVPL